MVKRNHKEIENVSLSEADQIAEDQQIIYPTDSEKSGISSFCDITLKCKKIQADTKEKLKIVKPAVKQLREIVLNSLKNCEDEILQIPSDLRKEADSKLSPTMPKTPAYIRLTKNTKDLTISTDIISEAFQNVTEDDIMECDVEGTDALIQCVLKSVRRLIRSFNEQAKLTDTLPRGVRAADVKISDIKIAQEAIKLHEQSALMLITEKQKRDALASSKLELAQKSIDVEKYFDRANMTSQRVNIENQSYNLCCRTSVSRPKVTFKILEEILEDGVKNSILVGGKKALTKKDIVNILDKKRNELLKIVVARFGTLQTTSKKVIHLQRVGIKQSTK